MSSQKVLIPAILAFAMIGLGCSGLMGGGGSGRGGDGVHKLKVGKSAIKKRSGKRDKRPTGSLQAQAEKKDEYIVKLAPGVKNLKVKGKQPQTGNKKLDSAFGSLSLKSAGVVHRSPKNRKKAEALGLGRTIHIHTSKPKEQVLAKLEAHPDVDWVEAVVEARAASVPNDPYWQYQWHMQNLNVTEAWEITQGEGVVVAVVDTGVSANEDGFHKLLKGYDFVDDDSDASDQNGHGTHVAGTIGQKSNNGIGVAGVAPKVSILPVRVLDASGAGSNTWVANGIIWATDHGANVINLSLGSPVNSEVVADACAYAYENGVTVVAATGNDGFSDFIGFPAALPTTIAVGSVDPSNDVAFYSNQGVQIDLVAPGGDTTVDSNGDGMQDGVVQETLMGGTWSYYFLQGTSMATPHVAGAAALVYANGVTSPDDIRAVLNDSANDLGTRGWDSVYGNGMLDPVAALGAKAPRDSGGKLKITETRVKATSRSRVVVGWITTEPATTMIRGGEGFKRKDDTPTKMHKVTVQGSPGETITYTIGSVAGNKKVRDEVTVTF